ncbi:MAG TPA: SUMF1/EgtB/PvdO family nonheme iron enzyme [Rariglobus sp.]|jgi:hypothetical protein|nr:SUMF1/EgtB/PvdO family nonheme iron enzyme [Rariglobus sp.]
MQVTWKKRRFIPLLRSARPWILVAIGLAALGWFFYFLATLGPRRVDSGAPVEVKTFDDPAVSKLSAEITNLEKQYNKAADANLVTSESIDKLSQALDKQKELVRIYPAAGLDQSTRLMRLDTELGNAQAKLKMASIDLLEKDGADALENADADLASAKFTEALRLQREINTSSASSRYKNYVRETAISQQLARLEAAPLQKEVKELIAAAHKAVDEKRWGDALTSYTQARDIQDRINRDYGRTVFSDLSRVDDLDSEIESLNAAGIAADIDAKEKAGDDAIAKGDPAAAVTYFATAGDMQLQINQKFPKSRFVSSDRIEALEIKKQTAMSANTADALAELDRAIGEHLKKRQVVLADQKIGQAIVLVDKLFSDYPKSRRIDGGLKLKLSYLALKRSSLRSLQDQVYERLLPMPGVPDRLLLKTEVSQELYLLVMNTNPSRNPGRGLPVDSVNWNDAREFCARLSWLLGTTVRLPTMDEFRVALGDGQSACWNQTNSDGHSQEVGRGTANGTGFYDLLGNVAEWTGTPADDDTAFVFGGSYLDAPDVLSKVPSEARSRSDRARQVGFRVVVDQTPP